MKYSNKIVQKKYVYLFILLISAIVYFRWLSFKLFISGDWIFTFSEALSSYLYPSFWQAYAFTGQVDSIIFRTPINFISGFFAYFLHWDSNVTDKFLFFWPQIFLLPLSSFLFVRQIVKNNIGAMVGSIVFSFNTYYLTINTAGHNLITVSTAFCLLGLYFLIIAIDKRAVIYLVTATLFFAIGGFYDFRILYLTGGVIALYPVLFLGNIKFSKQMPYYAFIFVILGMLNIFWILPIPCLSSTFADIVLNRSLFGDQFWSLSYAFTLMHPFWTGAKPEWFTAQSIPSYFWLIPIIAIIGLIFERKNLRAILFGCIGLAGIFLAKQTDAPEGWIYVWLFNTLPGFEAFREASKFYFYIIMAYSVLYGYFISYIWKIKMTYLSVNLKFVITTLVAFLFLFNAYPIFTGKIKTMFVEFMPNKDYEITLKNLKNDNVFFRTLWVPRTTKMVPFTSLHPQGSAVELFPFNFNRDNYFKSNLNDEEKIIELLSREYMRNILCVAAVKYVVVPIQDFDNEDDIFYFYGGKENPDIRNWYISELDKLDYLEKIDIGTEELVVYENKDYKPHIFALNNLNGLKTFDNLENKYTFLNDELKNEFAFYDVNKKDIVSENLIIPFEELGQANIYGNKLNDSVKDKNELAMVYVDKEKYNLVVDYQNNILAIDKIFKNNLLVNSEKYGEAVEADNAFMATTSGQNLFAALGSRLISLKNNSDKNDLGIVTAPFDILSVEEPNAILNAGFENGAWSETVGDCNAYDDKPILAMELSDESAEGNSSIQLEATQHIACTGQKDILVEGGKDYIFAFDYQSPNARHGGYYIKFNDEWEAVIAERLPVTGEGWNHFQKKLSIPEGATGMSLVIYSYAMDEKTNVIIRYDNFQLKQLKKIAAVDPEYKPEYEKIELAKADEYKIEYGEDGAAFDNLIKNPSFENGLWGDKVGDCNAYDNNGKLSMEQNAEEKSDGAYSLQLGATRHIACTGPGMLPVTEERTYLFSFDFQSPNAKQAGYYLGFNDPERTVIAERIPVEGVGWQNYTKQIKIPYGASAVSLVVYSYAGDGKKEIITRYDNFSFIELPDLEDRYFIVTEPAEKFVNPASVEFELINPTKKKVHIKGATTPFYLAMSESYHDQWQLQMNNDKINGFFNKWVPWVKPDRVADDKHFELNGFLNGWYVDTAELCQVHKVPAQGWSASGGESAVLNSACTKNADGSYDMEMTIEFFPQRWFYLGLLISGTTFAGCIGYLIFYAVQGRRNRKKDETQN